MARIDKKTVKEVHMQKRGWGYELWLENIPDYCGKILHFWSGMKGSLHFHVNKLETMYLKSGKVTLRLIDPEKGEEYFVELLPGDTIKIPRAQAHQIICAEHTDSEIIEFSTMHEEDDSHRIQKGN